MMRNFTVFILVAFLFVQCKAPIQKEISKANVEKYAKSIKEETLKDKLYTFASDEFEGRETGEEGQKKAAKYLKDFYKKNGIKSAIDSTYYQHIPASYFDNRFKDTENVVAMIEGREFPDEVVVVSAHYDHLGVNDDGEIYNGADDDGSGTVGVLEIAQAFKKAKDQGYGPRRTLVFMHFTGEEKGLLGSLYYSENPIFPLDETVANLNVDMIGRVDEDHENNRDYVYVIGSDRLSSEMDSVINQANRKYTYLDLDYKYNEKDDPNRFYFRSDHYNFAKHNIPVTFFFNGVHADYHKPTDTPDKIDYDLLTKRSQLIFYSAWEIANRNKTLEVDKK